MTATRPAPLISVVVAVFNAAATLRRCLESVVRQTLADVELIVIDGGSTDGSVDIVRTMASAVSYWESERDRGVYHAWNKGLARARGTWVTFLGADDAFTESDVLARMVPHLAAAYPEKRVVYAKMNVVDSAGRVVETWGRPWEELREGFFVAMNAPHPGMMHHRSVFEEHGGFDESFRVAGDYELLLREFKRREAAFASDVVAVDMAEGGMSRRLRFYPTIIRECRRARHKNCAPGPEWRFWRWAAWVMMSGAARATLDAVRPRRIGRS